MSLSRRLLKFPAAKVVAAVAVSALAVAGLAASGGGSVAADDPAAQSGWSHGWPTASAKVSKATAHAVQQEAAARGALILRGSPLRDAEVDADGDGEFGPGDYFVFEEALRRTRSRERVGTASARCMFNTRTFMCDGTMKVDRVGRISVQGSLFGPRDLVLPVTGGTDRFMHATGQMEIFNLPRGNTLYVFDLRTR